MKTYQEFTDLSIPCYALSYLVNGDSSGITNEDKKIIDAYMQQYYDIAREVSGYVIFATDNDGNPFFTWYPEFGLACDCESCTILIMQEDETK